MRATSQPNLADTLLVGLYVGAELAANVTEAKPIVFLAFTVDGGTLIYALTFTLIDVVHERMGKRGAQKVVLAAFSANALLAAYVQLTVWMPSPEFFGQEEAYRLVLGATPRIVAASLTAFLISSLLDTEAYAWLARHGVRYRWARVLGSNAAGTGADSILFITLAFWGRFPLLPLILGNYAVKMAVAVASVPLIYARTRA